MKRELIFKIISITIGVFLGFIISEIGYRFFHYRTYETVDLINEKIEPPINDAETEKTLGEVIILSPEPRIVYELVPNSIFKFQDVLVRTNKDGYRDKDYAEKKPKNTRRVIGLGDSVMFGWGVEEGESYLDQLELRLNEKGEINYEVINTAVPGYNTVMEVEVLKQRIEKSEVDIVIINFVTNDFDLPNFIRKRPDYFGIKKSMILQRFEKRKEYDARLGDAPLDAEHMHYERDSSKVPEAYREMVGESSCIRALAELKEMSEAYDFEVLFLSHSPYVTVPNSIKETVLENGFRYVDIKPHWELYKIKNKSAEWKIAEKDYHPSLAAHQLISDVLYEELRTMEEAMPVSNQE